MSGHDIWVYSVRKLDYVLLPWGSLCWSWSWTSNAWSLPINFNHNFNNGHCKCYNLHKHLYQYCGRTLSAIPFHSFLLQPVYLWILSSCLMTISFLFALTNWTVIILAITKNNTYCPSLFLRDGVHNKTIGTFRWFYSFIGLVIICMLLLLRLTVDKSQVGTFDLGWVSSDTAIQRLTNRLSSTTARKFISPSYYKKRGKYRSQFSFAAGNRPRPAAISAGSRKLRPVNDILLPGFLS